MICSFCPLFRKAIIGLHLFACQRGLDDRTASRNGFCALDAVKFASRVASYSISAMDSLSGIPTYEQIIAKDDWK